MLQTEKKNSCLIRVKKRNYLATRYIPTVTTFPTSERNDRYSKTSISTINTSVNNESRNYAADKFD